MHAIHVTVHAHCICHVQVIIPIWYNGNTHASLTTCESHTFMFRKGMVEEIIGNEMNEWNGNKWNI